MPQLRFRGTTNLDHYRGEHVPNLVFAAGKPKNPDKPEGEKYDGLVEVTEDGAKYLLAWGKGLGKPNADGVATDAFEKVEAPKAEKKADSKAEAPKT
jgi:hypothetical protein